MKKCMIILISVLIGTGLLSFSCVGKNKHLGKNRKSATESFVSKTEEKQLSEPSIEIKEVEEKLVSIDEKLPDPHRYFVIIGSFRNPDNAKKYQGQILKKGFSSEILKNEAGLYRVSVISTDEIEPAREDIRRIWRMFPEYNDTWLLVQMK
jgi:cell division protein FtsN